MSNQIEDRYLTEMASLLGGAYSFDGVGTQLEMPLAPVSSDATREDYGLAGNTAYLMEPNGTYIGQSLVTGERTNLPTGGQMALYAMTQDARKELAGLPAVITSDMLESKMNDPQYGDTLERALMSLNQMPQTPLTTLGDSGPVSYGFGEVPKPQEQAIIRR